jgi:hypothetical protein
VGIGGIGPKNVPPERPGGLGRQQKSKIKIYNSGKKKILIL